MFPIDILEQAWQGNPVAWDAIIFGILMVGAVFFDVFLFWKMGALARSQFANNVRGHNPTVAQCYENRKVKFFCPEMLRNGLAIMKGALYMFPKLWAAADTELTPAQRDILNAVYTIDASSSAFFINYAIQAGILNPGIVAMIEHEQLMQKLKPGDKVEVDKKTFIEVLTSIKDEKIQIHPLYFNFPIGDIRALKTWLPKSLGKSNLIEHENKVRQDERGNKEGFNAQTILILLMLVLIAISGIGLAKQFGLF